MNAPGKKIPQDPLWLGKLLVQQRTDEGKGGITLEQFESAKLEYQRNTHEPFAVTLERLSFISQRTVAELMSKTHGLPVLLLPPGTCSPELAKKLPFIRAKNKLAIPCREEGATLVIAVADPSLYDSYDASRDFPNRKIRFVISPRTDILHSIDAAHAPVAQATTPREALNEIIADAISKKASDIHFDPKPKDIHVRYRIDGKMVHRYALGEGNKTAILQAIKTLGAMDLAEKRLMLDGRAQFPHGSSTYNLRMSTTPTERGESAVIRLQDENREKGSLSELGLIDRQITILRAQMVQPNSLFIVTGPTGSGKTTLVYAVLESQDLSEESVFTVENPVEYQNYSFKQVSIDERVKRDYAHMMKGVLRQDPDVIFVGEMRDEDSASAGIQAAMTGHRVYSTLHTRGALAAISRLSSLKVDPLLIADALNTVCGIRLVRTLCKHCARPAAGNMREYLCKQYGDGNYLEPVGCMRCGNGIRDGNGYSGRTSIFEVFPLTGAEVSLLIINRKPDSELEAYFKARGFASMLDDGLEKARQGITTVKEVLQQVSR